MHTPDLVNANIERIAEPFPTCVTESRDAAGKLTRAINRKFAPEQVSYDVVDSFEKLRVLVA